MVTKHAPRALQLASWSAKVEARKKYCSGFQRPPLTCPAVAPPYSTLPQLHPPETKSKR